MDSWDRRPKDWRPTGYQPELVPEASPYWILDKEKDKAGEEVFLGGRNEECWREESQQWGRYGVSGIEEYMRLLSYPTHAAS